MVEGVAGVNMPMLVSVMTYRQEPLLALVDKALSGGREGVVRFWSVKTANDLKQAPN